jgi:hypothetical protein
MFVVLALDVQLLYTRVQWFARHAMGYSGTSLLKIVVILSAQTSENVAHCVLCSL